MRNGSTSMWSTVYEVSVSSGAGRNARFDEYIHTGLVQQHRWIEFFEDGGYLWFRTADEMGVLGGIPNSTNENEVYGPSCATGDDAAREWFKKQCVDGATDHMWSQIKINFAAGMVLTVAAELVTVSGIAIATGGGSLPLTLNVPALLGIGVAGGVLGVLYGTPLPPQFWVIDNFESVMAAWNGEPQYFSGDTCDTVANAEPLDGQAVNPFDMLQFNVDYRTRLRECCSNVEDDWWTWAMACSVQTVGGLPTPTGISGPTGIGGSPWDLEACWRCNEVSVVITGAGNTLGFYCECSDATKMTGQADLDGWCLGQGPYGMCEDALKEHEQDKDAPQV